MLILRLAFFLVRKMLLFVDSGFTLFSLTPITKKEHMVGLNRRPGVADFGEG